MTSIRRFTTGDLFKFNNINLDVLTETYNISFYLSYLARWPDIFYVTESPNKTLMGYIMGKTEGRNKEWHGHVTALTVAPEYRRLVFTNQLLNPRYAKSARTRCQKRKRHPAQAPGPSRRCSILLNLV
ncbi:n-alpha-acetyltransferase 20, NatB catalytic subunit-like protein [Basidiobolus meristosporus CBS 931.73]|uniref:N-alpha-acetyltransferase 20, NatB catalytic subunit-like protein n=1 Tax=Basidiobolus meristosporus CBS 931.73 TaxID=1314790 RepID=A0A1Y1VUE0_9FUNG|nr:n-alpha-acetyltransferase 20, NatB catalytic subunit-like protein [Basidiobolus meristosporus CBS 931.73]|eukprot:ORX64912.1 n-alpha-acetyltransferase 20, NatB catalytic subunit-like protein [Basidiobolus meristosporus CBS 931.73]